jgi:hypothetical protein
MPLRLKGPRESADIPDTSPAAAPSVADPRTRHLRRGNPRLNSVPHPPLQRRVGTATAAVLGAELGELVYAVLEGMKRGVVPAQAGRLLLERVLPASRPLPFELPVVEDGPTMRDAVRIAARAWSSGQITTSEMREIQAAIAEQYRSVLAAEAAQAVETVPVWAR